MSETATKLLQQVLALPDDERLYLAERLWESVGGLLEYDVEPDPEFQAELERRLKEVEEHPERLLDGEEVFRELRERMQKRQQS